MKISIIIPAFNEERLLGQTLREVQASLPAFVAQNWATELIVCDNNSTDHTAEIARAAGATVVFEPVNQIARARTRLRQRVAPATALPCEKMVMWQCGGRMIMASPPHPLQQ